MRRGPVAKAVRGGISRRRVQTIVIGIVLLVSTGASVLALGLVVDSSAPFDHAFAAQRGAHLMATVNPAIATPAELAATTRLPGVTAAAGPFAEVNVTAEQGGFSLGPMNLVGRPAAGGPVDAVVLQSGHWATQPGQLVLASDPSPGDSMFMSLGSKVKVTSLPGKPILTVVGMGSSVTSTADGWVAPGEIGKLSPPGTAASSQMLYRFASAGSTAAIRADARSVAAALPAGAVTGAESYLSIKTQQKSDSAPFVPFLIAFGVIGLVMSVLIVANVVSGAVASGYRRIGILKSIGFTPGQVVAAYVGQVAVPAVAGCVGGVLLGNLMAAPLLAKTAQADGVGSLGISAWVDVAVPVAMLCMVGLAALLPALRASRLSAVQAIAAGRAPRQGRGYMAHRLLGKLGLPRPVTIGLAAPFARPARTVGTLVAILLGATAVTFAVGLSSSLGLVVTGLSHDKTEQVQVTLNSGNNLTTSQQQAVESALATQPGARHVVAEADQQVNVAGLSQQVQLTSFGSDASWTGYDMISGHWYTGPGQVDVATGFLNATGKAVGDIVTITAGRKQIPVRIVGQVFDANGRGMDIITDSATLAGASPSLLQPDSYDIQLQPGVSPDSYSIALGKTLGSAYMVQPNSRRSTVVTLMLGIIGTLTLLLSIVAGLGVLNTIVLYTRERVHDLGIFKAVGMTPRQAIAMVVCWVAGTGLLAGLIAVPAGIALLHVVLPDMAASANLGVPASFLNVYHGLEIAALALAGLVIAVLGALLPASWAANTRTATALHAE